jgi:hypothetical protein
MTVGVNEVGDPVLQPFRFGQNAISFKGGIYQGAGLGSPVTEQVAAYGHPGQPYLLNFHSLVIIPNKLTFVLGRLSFTATEHRFAS